MFRCDIQERNSLILLRSLPRLPDPCCQTAPVSKAAMQEPSAAATIPTISLQLSGFPDLVLLGTVAHIGHRINTTNRRSQDERPMPHHGVLRGRRPARPLTLRRPLPRPGGRSEGSASLGLSVRTAPSSSYARVCFPQQRGCEPIFPDVFLYRADTRATSLHMFPRHYLLARLGFRNAIGVVASGESCSVVIPKERNESRLVAG